MSRWIFPLLGLVVVLLFCYSFFPQAAPEPERKLLAFEKVQIENQEEEVSPVRVEIESSLKAKSLVIPRTMEDRSFSEEELAGLADLYESIEPGKLIRETFDPGESILTGYTVLPDGSVRVSFLGVNLRGDADDLVLHVIEQAHRIFPNGEMKTLASPQLFVKPGQDARISLTDAEGNEYALEFAGELTDDGLVEAEIVFDFPES